MSTHQNDAERLLTRLAFNQFTLAGTTALEDVAALADLGYSGLSLFEFKVAPDEVRPVSALMAQRGLRPALCSAAFPSVLPIPGWAGPADVNERVDLIISLMDRYREFGEYTLILLTGAEPCIAPEDERRKAVVGFRRVAEAAAERQVKVAIEPVRNIGVPGSLVWSVREAAELVSGCRSSPGAEPPRRSSLVWQTSI